MRIREVVVTLALSIATSGCGILGSDHSRTFESLIELVERGEAVLEEERERWSSSQEDFLRCLTSKSSPSDDCEFERVDLEMAFDSALERYDFSNLKAELLALRLADNAEASRSRDAFVRHLRAWREYISNLRYSMPTSSEVYWMDFSFAQKWKDFDVSAIQQTFDEICSGLGNAQPKNSDEFELRIIDICDD